MRVALFGTPAALWNARREAHSKERPCEQGLPIHQNCPAIVDRQAAGANAYSRPLFAARGRRLVGSPMQPRRLELSSFREIHLAQELLETGVVCQILEQRLADDLNEADILLSIGAIEPTKRNVSLSAKGVDHSHVERGAVRKLSAEDLQSHIRVHLAAGRLEHDWQNI
jgi:hypothetical protein